VLADLSGAAIADEITKNGWTVVPDVLRADEITALREAVGKQVADGQSVPGTNQSTYTDRVRNLLARDEVFPPLAEHPLILAVVRSILGRDCLLNSMVALVVHPGAAAQGIHTDTSYIPVPRPHDPLQINAIWALDDFTEANGATVLVPGTAREPLLPVSDPFRQESYGIVANEYTSIQSTMTRGSVLVFNGSMWHGAGANSSDGDRFAISAIYCVGWLRQQENLQLGIPFERIQGFSNDVQALIGMETYAGFMGNINFKSPREYFAVADARPSAP
jgi:ectoine hydroxylase-related dioxygenase (phytanoyl-CoA dioxygenase family)